MAAKVLITLLLSTSFAVAGVIDSSLIARQNNDTALPIDECPGYTASNVQSSGNRTISADLSLAGTACNTYGTDLSSLKLQVEYQTGKSTEHPAVRSMY